MPDELTPEELEQLLNYVMNGTSTSQTTTDQKVGTSTVATSTIATSTPATTSDLTGNGTNMYNELTSPDSPSMLLVEDQGFNESMDYDFISALLLLGIFIITLFDFLRRHSAKF